MKDSMGGESSGKHANGENPMPLGGLAVEKSGPATNQSVRDDMGLEPKGETRKSVQRDVVKTGYGN